VNSYLLYLLKSLNSIFLVVELSQSQQTTINLRSPKQMDSHQHSTE